MSQVISLDVAVAVERCGGPSRVDAAMVERKVSVVMSVWDAMELDLPRVRENYDSWPEAVSTAKGMAGFRSDFSSDPWLDGAVVTVLASRLRKKFGEPNGQPL